MNAMTLVHSVQNPSATLDRDDLRAALDIVIGATERRSTVPILGNVRLSCSTDFERCITVTATDLDMEISVNVRAATSEEFTTTVPAHSLRQVLRKIPETERNRLVLELLPAQPEKRWLEGEDGREGHWEDVRRNSFASDRLEVRLGRATFELKSLPVDDFPEMAPFAEDPCEFIVAGSALWNALDAVKGGMSTEETRHYLNGAYLHLDASGTLALTATDGHKLLRQQISGLDSPEEMPGVIIPAAAVNLLHGLMRGKGCPREVDVFVAADKVAFNWGPVSVITKTVDGTFPDYGRVIPVNNQKIAVVRPSWLSGAVAAVTAMADDRAAVVCDFSVGKVKLSAIDQSIGNGAMEIECSYSAEPLTIKFDAHLVAEMLAKAAPDKGDVTLHMAEPSSPILVTGSIEGWSGVLMPMRI